MSYRISLPDPAATLTLGQQLGQTLPAGTVLLLRGDLGSGKTSLVQGIGQGLGISDLIVSPTFTLVVEYLEGRIPLYHFDLYRLPDQAEAGDLDRLGLDFYWDPDSLEREPGLVAIEWPDRLQILPPSAITLTLTPTPSGGRQAHLATESPHLAAILETVLATVSALLTPPTPDRPHDC